MKIRGFDLYVQSTEIPAIEGGKFEMQQVANRGTPVWTKGSEDKSEIQQTNVQRCRFELSKGTEASFTDVCETLTKISAKGVSWSMLHLLFADGESKKYSG